MQVLQTDGDPPNMGRIIFAIIGWTQKRREAEINNVREKRSGKAAPPLEWAGSAGPEDVRISVQAEMRPELLMFRSPGRLLFAVDCPASDSTEIHTR
jgi:hypothetical protein